MYKVSGDCHTDHYLLVAKVREKLAVNKIEAQQFDGEIFNLRKLNELEVRKQYQIEISNRFATLENLSDSEDINRAWENIKETIKISAKDSLGLHELKQDKSWLDEECFGFLVQRKQAKMQWVQDPSQSTADNLNNVGPEDSRHFRNKNKEYLKAKIEELGTNSNIKNIRDFYRGINDFRLWYMVFSYRTFLASGGVLVQCLNHQPGGPWYLCLSDLSPSSWPARETLLVAMLPPALHLGSSMSASPITRYKTPSSRWRYP